MYQKVQLFVSCNDFDIPLLNVADCRLFGPYMTPLLPLPSLTEEGVGGDGTHNASEITKEALFFTPCENGIWEFYKVFRISLTRRGVNSMIEEKKQKEKRTLMVTIKEIAKLAGVSRGTVDRVLNNRPGVKPDTEAEIRRIAAELGYTPILAGRILAGRKKNIKLAFISFDAPQYSFFRDVCDAARKKADELKGLGVTVNFYMVRGVTEQAFIEFFAQIENDGVDGVVTTPMTMPLFEDFLSRMRAKDVPFVFYNVDAYESQRLCYIGCDYVKAGRVAAGLTALCLGGEGKVAVLTHCDSNNQSYMERTAGYVSEIASRYPAIKLLNGGEPTIFAQDDYASVETLIRSHPELSAVYIVNLGDYSVCQVAHDAAEGRRLNIITNDLVPAQRRMLNDGVIAATLGQQPEIQGAKSLQVLYENLIFGITPACDKCFTELHIYISQNID